MAREIIWTNPAWDDVENAADYIAQDSKFYAAAFVREIREAVASLAPFAERGQVVPEPATNLSENCSSDPIVLSTRYPRKQVLILTLVHGAQRIRRF